MSGSQKENEMKDEGRAGRNTQRGHGVAPSPGKNGVHVSGLVECGSDQNGSDDDGNSGEATDEGTPEQRNCCGGMERSLPNARAAADDARYAKNEPDE